VATFDPNVETVETFGIDESMKTRGICFDFPEDSVHISFSCFFSHLFPKSRLDSLAEAWLFVDASPQFHGHSGYEFTTGIPGKVHRRIFAN
jgi:hypothetical protein